MVIGTPKATIVGAGMTGPLMAIFLARRGFAVDVYERRGDLRREPVDAGKSIKLTLAERGLHALREVGLEDEVKAKCCIALHGRAVHSSNGAVAFIPYGKNEQEVIYSFSRTDLNTLLLAAAEAYPSIRIHFHKKLLTVDKETGSATFRDGRTGEVERVEADFLIGADGAFSTVRQQIQRGERADFSQEFLRWGYKELSIVASADGLHQMEKHALHIWPCGDHMLFALPNLDGSFNGVCTLPFEGEHGFDSIHTDEDVLHLFRTYFGDALSFMPNILAEYAARPVSEFLTLRTSRWHHQGKVVLIGDAVHTVVPFYGQGMNAGFEDCSILDKCLERHGDDRRAAFVEFQSLRKRHTDILAELSVSNFHELRDTVRRPVVAARKRTSIFLNRLLGQHSLPLYTMISHGNMPYADCVEKARRQDRIARFLGLDLAVGVVAAVVRMRSARARRQARRQRAVDLARERARRAVVQATDPDGAGS
jgi:kynurenine 3-monooxygenase